MLPASLFIVEVVAQWLEQRFVEPLVAGSSPVDLPKIMTNKMFLKLNGLKGGVSMEQVSAVLRKFDRLENNPYFPGAEYLQRVLTEYGYLTLMVFICPKMRGKYLDTSDKELFMPVEEPKDGLVFARLPKLRELISELWKLSIPSKLVFVIGDNGFELYKGPSIGIYLNKQKMDARRQLYLENLATQLTQVFRQLLEVVSLGLMNVEPVKGGLAIPSDMLAREIAFQNWSFDKYYGGKKPTEEGVKQLAEAMIRSYAGEGYLVEMADAILIGTEGTNLESWTRRIQMFQVGGAKFPVIFPYIRMEELDE